MLVPSRTGPLLRAAWTLLLAYVAVPLPALALVAATGTTIGAGLELGLAALVTAGCGWWLRRTGRGTPTPAPADPWEPLVAAGALLAGLLANAWYTDAKALVAHRSYVASGEAECFYLLSFRFWEATNPGATAANVRDAFSIISTPSNVLFTAGIMPAAGFGAFHVSFVAASVLLFAFAFALVRDAGGSRPAALLAAAFAVANPYFLSIEELDRNVLALVLSVALFHALHAHPDRPLLHGLLLGVAAGTGLRFLPLTLAVALALAYAAHRKPWKSWAIALAVAALAFAPNLPHLAEHGLHSMGETSALPALGGGGLLLRTPFLALPNVLFYPMQLLRLLGAATVAALSVGLLLLARTRPLLLLQLVSGLVPTLLVLSAQRDWIEGDKHRILLWALAPAIVALGLFLDRAARRPMGTLAAAAAALVAVWAGGEAIARVEGRVDGGFWTRKPVYQSESPAFAAANRAAFTAFGLAPSFDKLFQKPRLGRKARYEEHLRRQLGLDTSEAPPAAWGSDEAFVDLRIDLAALVAGGDAVSLRPAEGPGRPFLSLQRPEELFDVYHRALEAPWQPEPLQATALPSAPLVVALRELTLELNAFASVGADDDGFEKVLPIHRARARSASANDRPMLALPQPDGGSVLVLRVPRDFRVVLRDWYLQAGSGAPYRTDGWEVTVPREGPPAAVFFPMEPESHL